MENVSVTASAGGVAVTTIYDESKIRFYDNGVAIWLKAGSDGTAYTVLVTLDRVNAISEIIILHKVPSQWMT